MRNLMGFVDGTANLRPDDAAVMDRYVWVQAADGEPAWATGGSYHVVRVIRMFVEFWDRTRLSRAGGADRAAQGERRPARRPARDRHPRLRRRSRRARITPLDAHIRLANPRTPETDDDLIFRKGISFSRGFDGSGRLDQGLAFVSYQRTHGPVPAHAGAADGRAAGGVHPAAGRRVLLRPPGRARGHVARATAVRLTAPAARRPRSPPRPVPAGASTDAAPVVVGVVVALVRVDRRADVGDLRRPHHRRRTALPPHRHQPVGGPRLRRERRAGRRPATSTSTRSCCRCRPRSSPTGPRSSPTTRCCRSSWRRPVGLGGWLGAKLAMAAMAGVLAWLLVVVIRRRLGVGPPIAVHGGAGRRPQPAAGHLRHADLPRAARRAGDAGAFWWLTGPPTRRAAIGAALAVVALPWLSVKYAPVAAVLAAGLLVQLWRTGHARRAGGVLAGLVVAGVTFLAGHIWLYGGWTAYASGSHFTAGDFSVVGNRPDYVGRSQRLAGLLVDRYFGLAIWQPAFLAIVPAAAVHGPAPAAGGDRCCWPRWPPAG